MTIFTTRNSIKYRTSIELPEGKTEAVRFEPPVHYGSVGESTYATSSEKIIEAMKRHPGFGRRFWIKEEILSTEETAPETENARATLEELLALIPEGVEPSHEQSVTSADKARKWMQAQHDVILGKQLTAAQVKAECAKRGVLFPNWDIGHA